MSAHARRVATCVLLAWFPVAVLAAAEAPARAAAGSDALNDTLAAAAAGTSTSVAPAAPISASLSSPTETAWWTGSLLSASAETMAVGHWLAEPYALQQQVRSAYDPDGRRHPVPSSERQLAAAYLMYGLADGVSVGAMPHLLLHAHGPADASSGPAVGDLTALLQLRLTSRAPASAWPAMSVVIGETFPTGRFDRLRDSPGSGSGEGVHRTDLSLYAQSLFHTPGNRLLRARLNLTYSRSDSTAVDAVSVYGTPAGFQGRARPGNASSADLAFELSLSLRWVLALDVQFQRQERVVVDGVAAPAGGGAGAPLRIESGPAESWALAPAVEYNLSANVGVIAGLKLTVAGRNTAVQSVPAIALNMYF